MSRLHQIYFLQRADGLIKIGTSADFQSRLAGLTKSHGMLGVVRLINGDRRRELHLHNKFKRFHEYGEWFRPERGALVKLIMALPEGAAEPASKTDSRKLWADEDAKMAREAAATVEAIVELRRQRSGLKTQAALDAISTDYGLPTSFLAHLRKRAATITAYGYAAVRAAYRTELAAALAYYRQQIDAAQDDINSDEELTAIGDRIHWIRDELAKRSELRLARSQGGGK